MVTSFLTVPLEVSPYIYMAEVVRKWLPRALQGPFVRNEVTIGDLDLLM